MPYFLNFLRFPSAGNMSKVLDAMKERHAAVGRPGHITAPVSAANPMGSRPALISTVGGFATLDDIDLLQTQFFENDQMQERQNAIDAMCDSTSYLVSEMLGDGPVSFDGYEPTVVSRLILEAKVGRTQELIESALDVHRKTEGNVIRIISRSLAGPISRIRMSVFATSLQALEDNRVETLKHIGNMPDLLAATPIRHVGRVVYRSGG